MGRCPTCGKQFELHDTVGPRTGLRVGDIAVCVGCASALVLEQVPYEYRLMTKKEIDNLDYSARELLEKAQANIREDNARETPIKTPRTRSKRS
jgi:hypothetical protein